MRRSRYLDKAQSSFHGSDFPLQPAKNEDFSPEARVVQGDQFKVNTMMRTHIKNRNERIFEEHGKLTHKEQYLRPSPLEGVLSLTHHPSTFARAKVLKGKRKHDTPDKRRRSKLTRKHDTPDKRRRSKLNVEKSSTTKKAPQAEQFFNQHIQGSATARPRGNTAPIILSPSNSSTGGAKKIIIPDSTDMKSSTSSRNFDLQDSTTGEKLQTRQQMMRLYYDSLNKKPEKGRPNHHTNTLRKSSVGSTSTVGSGNPVLRKGVQGINYGQKTAKTGRPASSLSKSSTISVLTAKLSNGSAAGSVLGRPSSSMRSNRGKSGDGRYRSVDEPSESSKATKESEKSNTSYLQHGRDKRLTVLSNPTFSPDRVRVAEGRPMTARVPGKNDEKKRSASNHTIRSLKKNLLKHHPRSGGANSHVKEGEKLLTEPQVSGRRSELSMHDEFSPEKPFLKSVAFRSGHTSMEEEVDDVDGHSQGEEYDEVSSLSSRSSTALSSYSSLTSRSQFSTTRSQFSTTSSLKSYISSLEKQLLQEKEARQKLEDKVDALTKKIDL